MPLAIKDKSACRWDQVSLGEVMLRLDPGEGRVHTARTFQVWEGGGEYNVARGLKRCFGLDTAVVTALVDNAVGRLVQDLIYQGGVDQSHVQWAKYDGVGRESRNGLNFVERGFGIRAGVGCSDRGHTAVSQLKPADARSDPAEVLVPVGGDRGVQAGVDQDRAGARVAEQEGRDGHRRGGLAGEQGPQQLQGLETTPRPLHHRLRPGDPAGDDRFDRDRGAGSTAGEWLVQRLGLDTHLHRQMTLPGSRSAIGLRADG